MCGHAVSKSELVVKCLWQLTDIYPLNESVFFNEKYKATYLLLIWSVDAFTLFGANKHGVMKEYIFI